MLSRGDANHALMPLGAEFANELVQSIHALTPLGVGTGEQILDRLELGKDCRIYVLWGAASLRGGRRGRRPSTGL